MKLFTTGIILTTTMGLAVYFMSINSPVTTGEDVVLTTPQDDLQQAMSPDVKPTTCLTKYLPCN